MPELALWLLALGVYDAPIECDECEHWNRPQEAFHVFGNTWYVGTGGLGAILIETDDGLVLLDSGLPQSAESIAANIQALGFDPADIKFIGISHAHFDHVGGAAALQRLSGAPVYASHDAAKALRSGTLQDNDPQFGGGMVGQTFPAVAEVIAVADGWHFDLPGLSLTALHTPGHTVGGTSWTWQSCDDERCLDIVYVDSLSPVSRPGYRYSEGLGEMLRETLGRIEKLDCDIMLSTHDFSFNLHEKLENGEHGFVDDQACRQLAQKILARLATRMESENL